jgi:Glycosyltransferase family 92
LPYLITCPINFDGEFPTSVSLTAEPCDDAENRLKILDNQPPNGVKQKFGICTKQLKYGGREFIARFIEWVQMLRLLGVHKIHLNMAGPVHPEMEKVLTYYEKQDFIEWVRYQDPSEIADHRMFSSQHRYLQMLILNDCFYRTKDLYDHIVLIDPDEIIIPMKEEDLTWNDIWNRLNSTYYESDSVSFANVYFPSLRDKPWSDIPTYDYMLQHVKRSKPELKPFMIHKSFFRPENILVVHNHRAFRCLKSKTFWCRGSKVPLEISQLNHYRNTVKDRFLNKTIKDRTIWKYKNELMNAVEETLNKLNFQP